VLYVIAAEEVCFKPEADVDAAQRQNLIVSTVKEMLSRGSFRGRNVVTCLPNDSLKIKSLRLDTTEPDEIEQFMREEVTGHFELNADSDEIRYMVAGSVHQGDEIKNEVIFFGAKRQTIQTHLSIVERSGLVPVAIDAVPCALFRSFQSSHRRQEDQDLVSVFVEVGSHLTTVIIGRGRQITFIKQIPIAAEQLNNDVASRLDIPVDEAMVLRARLGDDSRNMVDPAMRQAVIDAMSQRIEELAREVSLCFRYYAVTFRGERPQEAVFAGDEAYEPTLLNALKRHLGVEINAAQPLRGLDLSRVNMDIEQSENQGNWAVAFGLSMKGWDMSLCGA
jgi:type IV pilus assembly protein PilM